MTPDWPELYFVRHGETNWNAEGRYQGSRDIPLNDHGRGQADLNGDLLRRLLVRAGRAPTDFSWYVSPLSRTRETMDRIRARIGEPPPDVTIDPRLTEISFGIYEGHLHVDLAAGAMAIAGERDADFWYFRPPEGESYEDVAHRVADFGASLPGPAVVVAHGGILRILRRLIEDFPADRAVNWFPPQDCVVHFTNHRAVVYPAGQSWDD
ncbi:MAG TPA: histidine phosphatase family protein [Devosia sp.]|jgi:probable phosphoglycerate mutase|nr:histidine phosphatase family protein [Devosia sp.]